MSETFNPEMHYRCTIIRGKSQSAMEDLLPGYAKIITDICPCQKKIFEEKFDIEISKYLYSPSKKTIANHRTEITGKLFGMWREDENGNIHASKRTEKILENRDHPEFFKDVISKFQFPNGMDKIHTTIERKQNNIKIRPVAFVLKVLLIAEEKGYFLTKDEVAYYILNSRQVLQSEVTPELVFDKISENRQQNIVKKVEYPGKANSYGMQHITELLNLVALANLIHQKMEGSDTIIKINPKELSLIKYLAESATKEPGFNVYSYELEDQNRNEIGKKFTYDWDKYISSSDENAPSFTTHPENIVEEEIVSDTVSSNVIGERGENLVFEKEKQRVREFNERLVNKVKNLSNQRGFGYDIQSIIAEGPSAEHAIFIEVKTTVRVTKPGRDSTDSFDLTRNEWIAAEQYRDNFFIYRVYFTNEGIFVLIMKNPVSLKERELIYAQPVKFRVEFKQEAGSLKQWKI